MATYVCKHLTHLLPQATVYLTGVRYGQSIDVVLIPYIELTLVKSLTCVFTVELHSIGSPTVESV